jgi:ornithine cyclodeaminase/alanine dehydrogenase
LLYIGKADVLNIAKMGDLIKVMEGAFAEHGRGLVEMPLRHTLRSKDPVGTVSVMPAMFHGSGALGLKVVSHYSGNPAKFNIPTINATVLYLDYKTGMVTAVINGTYLTALRTAAVSGLATRYLARQDAAVLGLIGSGVEAETHLEAMKAVRPVESVKVFSPTQSHREAFARKMSDKFGMKVMPVSTSKEAATDSDIIVTATPSPEPVLKGEWLSEGSHVNAIGSGTLVFREIDEVVLQRSKIVADDIDAASSETGDFLRPMKEGKFSKEQIHAGLADLVLGRKQGRTNEKEITLFKSVGLALEDAAAAKFVYEEAVRLRLGSTIPE